MKHIFTLPLSALTTSKTHNTRSSNHKLHNMRQVEANHIAYAATHVSFSFPCDSIHIDLYVIRLTLASVHKPDSSTLMWTSSYLTFTIGLQCLSLTKSLRIGPMTSMCTTISKSTILNEWSLTILC